MNFDLHRLGKKSLSFDLSRFRNAARESHKRLAKMTPEERMALDAAARKRIGSARNKNSKS